ncbi:MAG: DUF6279 family lipoprotein [Burkholderiaceae bacterium]
MSGCSAIRLAYNNAEFFVYQSLDGFLAFDEQQEQLAKGRIAALLAWHRKEELPDYAQWLAKLRAQIDAPMSAAQVQQLSEDLRARSDRVIARATPELADLALTLTPENLKQLQTRYDKTQAELRKEYVDPPRAKQLERRFEQLLSSAERLFGSFSEEQRAQLRVASDARPLDHRNWLAERARRQQDIISTLTQIATEKPPRDVAISKLRAVAQRFSPSPDSERRAYFDRLNQATYEALALATRIATPQQRAAARSTLDGWASDLTALAQVKTQ